MDNQYLGNLFEKASIKILTHLFKTWGYEVLGEPKSQKSGTQFGFDLYFKIKQSNYPLNIFVECKASKKDKTIPVQELIEKSNQLNWVNFPRKDIHIYFSPTKEIELPNTILSLFDATLDFPFVVIDWMRKSDNYSKVLFLSYNGQDEKILEFKKFLLDSSKIETDIEAISFEKLSKVLLDDFHNCIDEAINEKTSKSFDYVNSVFWERIISNSNEKTDNLYN